MNKFLVSLLCVGLFGCATTKSAELPREDIETYNFKAVFNCPRQQVLNACSQAVKNKSTLVGPFFGKKGGILDIIIEGDNPTTVKIAHINSDMLSREFKQNILNEVKKLLVSKAINQ